MRQQSIWLLTMLLSACVAQGQEEVRIPLSVVGTAHAEPVLGRDGVEIVLDEARLAFGPLYLCAGTQAGGLCNTARVEWLDGVIVDALDPEPERAGDLEGISGPLRSWMYDLGITSSLIHEQPLKLPAARALQASVRLEGAALVEGQAIPFAAKIEIQQEEGTEVGVPLVRSSPGGGLDHDLRPDEEGLRLRFDASPWVAEIDFRALRADEGCEVDGPPLVCAGDIEQICATDGSLTSDRDCRESSEVCIVNQGCVDVVDLGEISQARRLIRNQIVAGPAPEFHWGVAS